MPLITDRIGPSGAVIDVLIGVDDLRRHQLTGAGRPVPPPVPVRVQLDTGASLSGLAPRVFAALGLEAVGTTAILTPSTPLHAPHQCDEFLVSLAVVAGGSAVPFIDSARVITAEGWLPGEGVEGLIGRDVLAHGTFMYFGTEGRFQFAM